MISRTIPISALALAAGLLASCQPSTGPQPVDRLDLGKMNTLLEKNHETGRDGNLAKPLHLISAEKPAYPAELEGSGLGGIVSVELVVGENGKVESAKVVNATDRRFKAPALESVRKWKFDPPVGTAGPRKVHVTQRIFFTPEKGDNGVAHLAEQFGSKLVPFHYPKSRYQQLWAGTPYLSLLEARPLVKAPRLIHEAKAVFPTSLYSQGGKAAVDASFVIGEDGSVEAVRIVDSTHPIVNKAVEAAVRQWKYEPALTSKGPVKVLWEKRFVFTSSYH